MRFTINSKIIFSLCLSILLLCSFNQSLTHAAGYTYGDYYNNNLTNTAAGNTQGPSISGKGDKVVFWSDRDLTGSNADLNPELFLWTSPSTITQITSDTVNTLTELPLSSINFAGDKIAYLRYEWPLGTLRRVIVLWANNTPTDTLFVPTAAKDLSSLRISGVNDRIVFRTNGDVRKYSPITTLFTNPRGSYELYLWDNNASTATQITTTTNSSTEINPSFSVNYDGTLVAFSTKENTTTAFSGKNPDGNFELYMWNKNNSSTTQIASSSGGTGSIEPSITSYTRPTTTSTTSVTQITFSSDRNFLGKNPDANLEIFLWTLNGTYSSSNTGSFTQITSTAVSGGACRNPQMSRDGKFITFVSNIDLISSGGTSLLTPSTSAIFVWNANGVITQVNTRGDYPVIGSYTGLKESDTIQYGPRIAYYSTADGSDDIYLATSTIPVPLTSRWGLMILVLLLAALAFYILKKRKKSPGAV